MTIKLIWAATSKKKAEKNESEEDTNDPPTMSSTVSTVVNQSQDSELIEGEDITTLPESISLKDHHLPPLASPIPSTNIGEASIEYKEKSSTSSTQLAPVHVNEI